MSNLSFAKKAFANTTSTPVSTGGTPINNSNIINNSAVTFGNTGPVTKPTLMPFVPTGQPLAWGPIRDELTRIGGKLDAERIAQRLSKREVARRTYMSPKTVGYVMRGYTQNINRYIEVANALKMQINPTY